MSLVKWTEEYSIGNKILDGHHQRLFEIINQLNDDLEGNHTKEAIDITIAALLDYAKFHFSEEEHVMQSIGYPGYEAHKAIHDAIIRNIENYHLSKGYGDLDSAHELNSYLRGDWLRKHILETDKKIEPYLKAHK